MSHAARKLEVKDPMEERIARLETHTSHLQEDVRRIEHKIDNKIEPKIDALAEKLDAFKDSFVAFQLETRKAMAELQLGTTNALTAFQLETQDNFNKLMNGRWADKVWWLVIAGAMLGVMARGFKWI